MAIDFINPAYVMKLPQNPKRTGFEEPTTGEHVKVWGQWFAQRAWKLWPFTHALLYSSSHLAFPELYPFKLNCLFSKQHVSLSSVSYSKKLIQPKERVGRTSHPSSW